MVSKTKFKNQIAQHLSITIFLATVRPSLSFLPYRPLAEDKSSSLFTTPQIKNSLNSSSIQSNIFTITRKGLG